jgi:small subunit ribosomal protein S20
MAQHKSALKQHRQSLRRRDRNRRNRSRMRTAVKRFRARLAAGDVSGARESLSATLSMIDRSAKLGALHGNAAARTKSRLARALARATAAAS